MYNPFEDVSCEVFSKDYVRVERINDTQSGLARFRKTFLASPRGDFRYWNNRENLLLLHFRQLRLKRVVQAATVSWNSQDEFDFIETLDAGPCLYDWLRVQPRWRDGSVHPHPFAAPGALLRFLRGAVEALAEIHRAGFVHGDVREGNICIPIAFRSGDHQWLSPDCERLRLIDFAFSFGRSVPLERPLPIEPRGTLHSPAYFMALETDSVSGTPTCVEQLDWRVDLYSLGELCKRLMEKHTILWPTGHAGNELRNKLGRLVGEMLRLDSTGQKPDPATHDRLLGQIETANTLLGREPVEAFTIHTLNNCPIALGGANMSAVRGASPSGPPKYAQSDAGPPASPTPIRKAVASPLSGTTPPASSSPAPVRVRSRLASPARFAIRPEHGVLTGFWDRLRDSVTIERYRQRASQGDPEACYQIGRVYACGNAVAQDTEVAAQWFRCAAEAGHARAQASIAWMYEMGLGVTRDDRLAVEWYSRAARQDDPAALLNLAIMISDGRGGSPNDSQAIQYLTRAASAGIADAYYWLGKMALAGRGVVCSREQAIECFRRAAEGKHSASARELGWLMERGGPDQSPDPKGALCWFNKALRLGCAAAEIDIQRITRLVRRPGVLRSPVEPL